MMGLEFTVGSPGDSARVVRGNGLNPDMELEQLFTPPIRTPAEAAILDFIGKLWFAMAIFWIFCSVTGFRPITDPHMVHLVQGLLNVGLVISALLIWLIIAPPVRPDSKFVRFF